MESGVDGGGEAWGLFLEGLVVVAEMGLVEVGGEVGLPQVEDCGIVMSKLSDLVVIVDDKTSWIAVFIEDEGESGVLVEGDALWGLLAVDEEAVRVQLHLEGALGGQELLGIEGCLHRIITLNLSAFGWGLLLCIFK